MQPNPRTPDPDGVRMAALVRARVPEEVVALRKRLDRLRQEQGHNQAALAAIDKISAGLDELSHALIRDMLGADTERRRGHR